MKSLILICLVGIACSYTIVTRAEVMKDELWKNWKSDHNKVYRKFREEKFRYTTWKDNLVRITEFNKKSTGVYLRINQFGDMTTTEFKLQMNGYAKRNKSTGLRLLPPSHVQIPDTVDWRNEGYVTNVKNQGRCGSCWAFSTTGSLEGQHFKKTGKLVSLSEQNLVDCSTPYGNYGCQGGMMDNAFRYIKDNDGVNTESSYPYAGTNEQCRFKTVNIGAKIAGYVDVSSGDENALKQAVATVGPISVTIDASNMSFQFYHSGVYNEPSCSSTQFDHAVLVVGYGTTYQGKYYWLVKNSWGKNWGQKGYIQMSRNKNNQCGIATNPSYPLV